MKTYLVIAIIGLTACNRQMHKTANSSQVNINSNTVTVDTSKTNTTITQVKTVFYGDTLRGSVFIPGNDNNHTTTTKPEAGGPVRPPDEGIIESSGMKIKTKVTPKGNGYNVEFEAVAKPKEVTENTTTNIAEQKGQSSKAKVKTDQESKEVAKDVKQDNSLMGLVALLVFLALIVTAIVLAVKKFKLL